MPVMARCTTVPGQVIDVAVIGAVLALDVGAQVLVTSGVDVASPGLGPVALAIAIADAGVFWWRRRRPLTVLVAAVVLAGVGAAAVAPGLAAQQTGITTFVASFAVGSWSLHRRRAAVVPAVVLVLFVVGSLDDGIGVVTAIAAPLAVIALPWALGSAERNRRLYVAQVVQRLAEAERDRDDRARRAVLDERTHIARELHDVVAHHVSLIVCRRARRARRWPAHRRTPDLRLPRSRRPAGRLCVRCASCSTCCARRAMPPTSVRDRGSATSTS